jgi:hypothetical protein
MTETQHCQQREREEKWLESMGGKGERARDVRRE